MGMEALWPVYLPLYEEEQKRTNMSKGSRSPRLYDKEWTHLKDYVTMPSRAVWPPGTRPGEGKDKTEAEQPTLRGHFAE